ncbi:MAG: hypothetical protein ACOC2W_02895 [bacterium]
MEMIYNGRMCKNTEDILTWLDDICDMEKYLTDYELADFFKEVSDYCKGNNKGNNYYFITHIRKDNLIKERVKKYCKKRKISIDDYDGPLPYKLFKFEDTNELRKKKLKKNN